MESEVYDQFFKAEDTHWWFQARRELLNTLLGTLYNGSGLTIADVGCGTGGMMKTLSEYGRVTGVDESKKAREYCARRGFKDVLSTPEWDQSSEQYDLVTAFDVVEHIDDDVGFLKKLYARIKPEGRILVTVPAYQFLWSEFDEMNHHKRRYTRKWLLRSLVSAGFRVERASYFNSILFPALAGARLVERLKKPGSTPQETLDRWFRVGPLNPVLRRIFSFERHWVKKQNLPFGSSILALGRK